MPELRRGMDYARFQWKNETLVRIWKRKIPEVWTRGKRACAKFWSYFCMTFKNCFHGWLLLCLVYPLAIERTKASLAHLLAKNIPNIEPDLVHWPIRMLRSRSDIKKNGCPVQVSLFYVSFQSLCDVCSLCRPKVVRVPKPIYSSLEVRFLFLFSLRAHM